MEEKNLPSVAPYPVGRFCGFLVKNPLTVMFVMFVVSLSCASLGFINRGEFGGSFTDLDDPIVRGSLGVQRGMRDWPMDIYGSDDVADYETARKQTLDMGTPLQIILRSRRGNALTLDALKELQRAQKKISNMPEYQQVCLFGNRSGVGECVVPSSPANIASWIGRSGLSSSESFPISQTCACADAFNIPCEAFESRSVADFNLPSVSSIASVPLSDFETLVAPPLRAMCRNGTEDKAFSDFTGCSARLFTLKLDTMGKGFSCTNDSPEARYIRTLLPFGGPFKEGKGNEDDFYSEREAFDDVVIHKLFALKKEIEMKNGDLEMFFWSEPSLLIGYYLDQDLKMLGLSFLLVFCALWTQTGSLFITICGLFEIIISYPLGLFVWHVILREPYATCNALLLLNISIRFYSHLP